MADLLILIGIFILVISASPFSMLQYLKYKKGFRVAIWKTILCIILFTISFLPYAFSLFLISANSGWINLIYFILIWVFFYIAHFVLPARISIIAPILLGLMLMIPASSFITVFHGHLVISLEPSQAIDLARGKNKLLDFLHDLFGIAWAILPLVGVHYLMNSIERK